MLKDWLVDTGMLVVSVSDTPVLYGMRLRHSISDICPCVAILWSPYQTALENMEVYSADDKAIFDCNSTNTITLRGVI